MKPAAAMSCSGLAADGAYSLSSAKVASTSTMNVSNLSWTCSTGEESPFRCRGNGQDHWLGRYNPSSLFSLAIRPDTTSFSPAIPVARATALMRSTARCPING